jgi:poly(3-hydroxybutyrate) depolymerase
VLAVLVHSPSARADVALAAAPDGRLGAWLVAGPVPLHGSPLDDARSLHPVLGERVGGRLGWLTWSIADGGMGPLDVTRALGASKGYRALVAGVLTVSTPLDGWLLVSADGGVAVAVDGAVVWRRARPHPRGPSWDAVPLALAAGPHAVVFDLAHHGPPWSFAVRVLDRATLEPPRDLRLVLPGATPGDAAKLAGRLARVDVDTGVMLNGYQPRVHIDFPNGAPVDPDLRASATLSRDGAPLGPEVELGAIPIEPTSVGRISAALRPVPAGSPAAGGTLPDEVRVHLGTLEHSARLAFPWAVQDVVIRALALRAKVTGGERHATLAEPDLVVSTLEGDIAELATLAERSDPATPMAAERLRAFVDRVEAGGDPVHDPGVQILVRRSSVDGGPDPLRIHVPAGYRKDSTARFPLVVVLHGYGGNPERVLSAFLGTESLKPHPRVDGFVLAPHGHGDAFYRGPGEVAVLDAIDWALRTYPIDPKRVAITGVSMGGTGAAQLGLFYAERFSAVAALAGYQSYFTRRDVRGRRLRAWEWAELSRWSPTSFAENGRDLHFYVAQGTKDLPLENSQSLVDRFHELGYPLKDEWPDIGHDVWRIAWGDAALWPDLSAQRSPSVPAHITVKTDALRHGSHGWATITGMSGSGTSALLDARVTAATRIAVKTSGVESFSLRRPAPRVAPDAPVTLVIDGARLAFGSSADLLAHREGTRWAAGATPAPPSGLLKRAGLEGPIRDAFAGPLAFVYGTLDPTETRAAREVAEHFRARWAGDARFPILEDTALTAEIRRTHSLFLVGSRNSNTVVRELDSRLPLGIQGASVRAGDRRVTGDAELGFACVYPDPTNASRYVVLVEAVGVLGLWRSLSLPLQLPDFIVFDSGLAPAAGQQVLGEARVLGSGYFDPRWGMPPSLADEMAAPTGRDGLLFRGSAPGAAPHTAASVSTAPRP